METYVRRTQIGAPAEEVFRWHARPGAFERLTPPWEPVELVARQGGLEDGALVVLRMGMGPISQSWVARHSDYVEGRQFRDTQVAGPFTHWAHTHRFAPDGPSACSLEDHIEYTLPLGILGQLGDSFVRQKLDRMFTYRHRITSDDIAAHARYTGKPMNILVSGTNGLIGRALVSFLTTGGHNVTGLVRSQPRAESHDILWNPQQGITDAARLEGFDAVVHLAGENVVGRWTAEKRARIRGSRVTGTRLLCEALARLSSPPKVVVSASAIGYYGNRNEEMLNEDSGAGHGFLPEVCHAWEEATRPAAEQGIRVVTARIGIVLSPSGGALAKMLLPFRLGVGGMVGTGEQYMSWVTLDDTIGAIHHALITDSIQGPLNITAPRPVTNSEFTATLGRVLGRPTFVPLPAAVARLTMGEMADELLLSSTRVLPQKLEDTYYPFRHPDLEGALRHVLGKV
ncbi:MAG: TIGR01777 family protein [Deltaproteobacteria bacterium]|nr:TIGR01777 family protein [Deltaproteobacteria bacterium]